MVKKYHDSISLVQTILSAVSGQVIPCSSSFTRGNQGLENLTTQEYFKRSTLLLSKTLSILICLFSNKVLYTVLEYLMFVGQESVYF